MIHRHEGIIRAYRRAMTKDLPDRLEIGRKTAAPGRIVDGRCAMAALRYGALGVMLAMASTAALAQADDGARRAGPAGSSLRAPYTRTSGQTVPVAGAADRRLDRGIRRRTLSERRDDRIDMSICSGC
ncbi:hypothetical protein [Methylobacterium sp. ID0610]|uniref:hypothetical protein n=1 Tax=Methylobacterium carpenticola TaxID=3344827 RepID=UPI00369B3C48